MNRPRVIIADTDSSYIVPLQLRFVDDFFNKIDLEIITQKQFFDTQFSTPQIVDVMVVSEQLFHVDLLRHDIRHLFVMTEDEGINQRVAGVTYLPRYSAIKVIFSEIVGKSYPSFNFEEDKKQDTQIVLVTSAAGGVGKTTLALGISASLAKSYKKVLYIDAEWMQTFGMFLSNPEPITANEVYAKLIAGNKDKVFEDLAYAIREEGFQYLPPFNAPLVSLGLSYRVFSQIAEAAKLSHKYDYIIIDSESAFGEEKARLINLADRVIVITKQSKASVHKTNCLCENMSGATSDKYLYICNFFEKESENYLNDSSEVMRFEVNDFVQTFSMMGKKTIESLAREKDIQRVAYLLI